MVASWSPADISLFMTVRARGAFVNKLRKGVAGMPVPQDLFTMAGGHLASRGRPVGFVFRVVILRDDGGEIEGVVKMRELQISVEKPAAVACRICASS